MKVYIYCLFLSLTIVLTSFGQTRDQIVRTKIENRIKPRMHDPASYEFVSLKLLSIITFKYNITSIRDDIKREIKSDESSLDFELKYYSQLRDDDFKKISELKSNLLRNKVLLKGIDSLERGMGSKINTEIAYNYSYECRGKNAFGAKVLSEYIVQVKRENWEIINVAQGSDQLIFDFGDFPGYKALSAQVNKGQQIEVKVKMYIDSLKQLSKDTSHKDKLNNAVIDGVVTSTATLELNGWNWDENPQLKNIQIESGMIIFQIKVDNGGELIEIKKMYGDLTAASEAACIKAIRNLTFTKIGGQVPDISTGRITITSVKAEGKLNEVAAEDEKIYMVVEQPAEFVGGLSSLSKFISKNLIYPESSRSQGIEGAVFVSFVVDKVGELSDLKIVKGLSADCNDEAIRLVSIMPPWKPGKQNGLPIKSRFVLPIRFKLDP
jgi:TonB family protein